MKPHENNPIRKYLDELKCELKSLSLAPGDALSDAQEFLQSEFARLRDIEPAISCEDAYSHFVDVFGRPRAIAEGYAERAPRFAQIAENPRKTNRRTMWRAAAAAALLVTTMVGLCVAGLLQEPPKLSPFTEVRFEANKPVVKFRGESYELIALDEIPAEKIVRASRDHFGDLWEKRFAEDLVEVLWLMEHRPKSQVSLQLRDPKSGQTLKVADAAMTEANRRQIYVARNKLEEWAKLSPFTEVRYDGEKAIVRVRGELYELVSLDDIETGKILQSAKDHFGNLWHKRFAEDLVEVLSRMGHRPKSTVKLQLRNLKTAEVTTIADAAMTEANRRQVYDARYSREEPPKLAPFTEVRYDRDKAIVRVRGELYELVSLDDIEAGKILQSAKDHFGNLWQKRFAEDLVEVLWLMGHRPKSTVKLQLRELTAGKVITIPDAVMTEANRQQTREAGKPKIPQPRR
jgi:hypothetical protein